MGGQLGAQNTLEVHWFSQRYSHCQGSSPQMPTLATLMALTIIDVPLECIGMAIVGPLPKSAQGHEYILVVLDYAICYPKVVPLWKATSTNNAKELMLLFCHVDILKDILTDQGHLSCPGWPKTYAGCCMCSISTP